MQSPPFMGSLNEPSLQVDRALCRKVTDLRNRPGPISCPAASTSIMLSTTMSAALRHRNQRSHPSRLHRVVGVQHRNVASRGKHDGAIARGGRSAIHRQSFRGHTRIVFGQAADDVKGVIRRSIVDDHDLHAHAGRGERGGDRPLDESCGLPGRNDDADIDSGHRLPACFPSSRSNRHTQKMKP